MKRLFSVLLLFSILALFFTGCPINPQNIPPTVVWVSGPPPVVTGKTCTFVWKGNDIDGEISRYEYKQDQADSWTSLGPVNTFTWSDYSNGSHTLHIRAIDDKNVASNPISWTFHYSGNINPIVNKISGPDGTTINQSSSTFVWEGFDPDGQITRYEYRRIVGTTPVTPWISNGKSTSRDWDNYPEGSCTFEVRAVDDSEDYSNVISWTFIYTISAGYNLTVTTTPDTNLKVKIDGEENPSPFVKSVDKGSSHTIQAVTPQEKDLNNLVSGTDMRYTFEKWTDGNTANPRTVTVNSDVTYTAQMKVEYKVETATQPSGITTISGSGWYTANTNKTFTAPTVTGYTFSHWLVNGDNAGSSSSLSLKIDNPKKVVAVYNTSTKHNLTVTTTPDTNLKVKIDGVESPSPFVKSVDKGSSHTIQAVTPQEKDLNNLVSGTDMRYTFEKWTDGNTANPRTVTVNSDVTYTAQMKVEYKVETATQPSGITTISGSGWYTANTYKTFTAPTVTGYTFSHWLVNGDNAGSSSSLSLKIDNPKKVVAVYENTSQNSGSLIIQGTANVSMQEFENGFLIWLRISGCNGMKAFELNLTATNSFTFEDIVFSSPNHIAGKKWSIVANNLQKKIVSVEAMSLDVAINGDQTLGYILCKTSTQILDWPILSGTFNWSDTQDKAYSAELLIVHYATDFNRDNEVTVGDLGFFANRYNSKLGDPKWNPICDLSGDGKIDFDDLSYFVNHWKH